MAEGVALEPSSAELTQELDREIARAKQSAADPAQTSPLRDLLRHGAYKPTGRGKPASEYLLNAAREDKFPRINNLVDALNMVSLRYLLPISLIDLDKRPDATGFVVRRGRAGEHYVFNAAGQTIDLVDLLLTASLPDEVPLANPVKDSMASKLGETASRVLAVVYAPLSLAPKAQRAAEDLASALARHGGAMGCTHGHIVRSAV